MITVDSSFYYANYAGTLLDGTEVEAALDKAAWDVSNLLNKNKNLTDFQIECVKYAICAQADDNKANNNGINGLASFSLGDMSISIDNSKKTRCPESVKRYLLKSGLLNRCI